MCLTLCKVSYLLVFFTTILLCQLGSNILSCFTLKSPIFSQTIIEQVSFTSICLFIAEGPPPTTKEVRTLTILKEIPFVVAFHERVLVFQSLALKDKMNHQMTARNFLHGPSINIMVRRNYLYEDAFDKLSPENGKSNNLSQSCLCVLFLCLPV